MIYQEAITWPENKMTCTLYGIPAGLYPGKTRFYLWKQAIDFVEVRLYEYHIGGKTCAL